MPVRKNQPVIEKVALEIAKTITKDVTVVTKSTVLVGTNEWVGHIPREHAALGIEIKNLSLETIKSEMTEPIVFDGRNCFSLNDVKKYGIKYYSIGRPIIE